jgi:hypothetical protein
MLASGNPESQPADPCQLHRYLPRKDCDDWRVPVWVAVVVGLGSGLISSIVSTLLTISHERAAEFRSRMLQSAEDFLRRAEAVRRLARRPRGTAAGEPLDALLDAWDDLVAAVVLVELLFGRDSEAAHWAREASNELKDVEEELRSALEAPSDLTAPISEQQIQDHMLTAGQAMDRFGAAAATQVRRHRTLAPAWPTRRARIAGSRPRGKGPPSAALVGGQAGASQGP